MVVKAVVGRSVGITLWFNPHDRPLFLAKWIELYIIGTVNCFVKDIDCKL